MYKCQFCGREFERSSQLGGHIIWCKENPNRTGKCNFNMKQDSGYRNIEIIRDDLFCQYCGKQCKNLNSLKQHEKRCKNNPNRIKLSPICKKGNIAWNKGLNKYIDERIKKYGNTNSERIKNGEIKNPGGLKDNSVKYCYKYGTYHGIRCDSSWELAYLVYCIEHNIEIERNTNGYEYFINNKKHLFYPDFFFNKKELVEIKGLQDATWEAKHEAYPDIIFLFKKDMIKYIEYVKKKYGNNFWDILYD